MKRIRVGPDNNEHKAADKETTVEMVQGALVPEELLFERSWTRRVFVMYSIHRATWAEHHTGNTAY
jgi:hypothetical protein